MCYRKKGWRRCAQSSLNRTRRIYNWPIRLGNSGLQKLILLVVFMLLVTGFAFGFSLTDWLEQAVTLIEANPRISWLLFGVVYVMATVLMLPGSLLGLAAGFVFGLGAGFVVVSISSVLGATCAFLVGRYLAREWVTDKLAHRPRFRALDQAVGANGGLVVFLTRLSPLFPFNLLNYALGLTSVKLTTYVMVSWIGMMPGTLLYVYLGSAGSDLTSLLAGDMAKNPLAIVLFYVGLLATFLLAFAVARISNRMLEAELDNQIET